MKKNNMKQVLEKIAHSGVHENINLWPRVAAGIDQRKTFMKTLHTRPLVAIVIALLVILLLTGVVYAIGKVTGYIPGVGIIDQSVPLRVLADPVMLEREGITVTIEQVVLSTDKTILTFKMSDVPSNVFPRFEGDPGCSANVRLRLPDGSVLHTRSGEMAGPDSNFSSRLVYDAVPKDVNEAVVLMACIQGVLQGALPENWEIPLQFVPAPPEMNVISVVEIGSATQVVDYEGLATPEQNIQAENNFVYGLQIQLDQYIPVDDGYYLIGHAEWAGENFVNAWPAVLNVYDVDGREVPVDPAIFENDSAITDNLQPNQWAYHLYGKNFKGPLTFRITQMAVEFSEPVRFRFDLSSTDFSFSEDYLGTTWNIIPEPISIPDINANVVAATYTKSGDLSGFEFDIQADPLLQSLEFSFESGLITEGLSGISAAGGSARDETSGLIISRVLTNAPMKFPLVISALSGVVNGNWNITWEPPVDTTKSAPVFVEQACLDLNRWKEISVSGVAGEIPAELSGIDFSYENNLSDDRLVVSPDNQWVAFAERPKGKMGDGVYISRLDGSDRRLIAQLDYWVALNPSWSQDSKWIVFYILNTDLFDAENPVPAAVNIENCDVISLTNK